MLRERKFAIIVAVFFSVPILGLVFAGYWHWYRPSELGRLAIKNARQRQIVPLPIPFPPFPFQPGSERIRPASPGSSVLLLENEGHIFNVPLTQVYYFAIDTSNNSIRPAAATEWNAATGEIIDNIQLSGDLPRPIFGWKQTDSAGRHVMERLLSPSGDYLAIVSADGRYHKPVRALLWGREAYTDGQHYLEIRPMKDGKLVGTPVAIPTEDELEPRIWWTKDERFIIVRFYKWDNIVVVPTDIARVPHSSRSERP